MELFIVAQVIREEPNVYELVDHKGEQIIGKFYEKLSAVDKKDDDVIASRRY